MVTFIFYFIYIIESYLKWQGIYNHQCSSIPTKRKLTKNIFVHSHIDMKIYSHDIVRWNVLGTANITFTNNVVVQCGSHKFHSKCWQVTIVSADKLPLCLRACVCLRSCVRTCVCPNVIVHVHKIVVYSRGKPIKYRFYALQHSNSAVRVTLSNIGSSNYLVMSKTTCTHTRTHARTHARTHTVTYV